INKRVGCASTVSSIIARELAQKKLISAVGRIIHLYGEPWVISLGNNLLGLNLDFQEATVKTIKELSSSINPPNFIVNAAVGLEGLLEPVLDNTFINNNMYDKWLSTDTPQKTNERDNDLEGPSF
ncbi:hypothetical protein RG357_003092, partial [Acinetobacter baumannii]|nr:hypothetical protein [Acinetobacter baumannii]EKV9819397.1 hypothetical protein [Acinetobacter baumannii]EKW0126929.1 hypothetical protein [Acinetobacter baumannii]ELB1435950.1 hypothetical protein [Acinetobacter baumannii]ELQ5484640.1 hypothetical protein [Acinetobacter baumannii]